MTVARRLTAALAGLVVAALALSGCLYAAIPAEAPRPTASATPDTDGVADDLLPFYGQSLTWSDCGTGLDCTTVVAPRDWDDPSAGEIELAVVRHRADSGAPIGSLIMNPGGPGASGWDYVHDYWPYIFGEPLIENYDLVGFDPRGVGQSSAVRCYDDAGLDAYFFDLPEAPRGTEAWREELLDTSRGFAEACVENSDDDVLPYLTTVQSARDMDLLRAVLGETQLDYLGASYGTLLGATYAGLYPDKVGRLVLDGGIDPSLPAWEDAAQQLGGFETAMRNFLADCVETEGCPFRGTVEQALGDLSTLLATVDASPLEASDGRRLDANGLILSIQSALYSEQSWPALRESLSEVLQGSADAAYQLIDFYYDRVGGVYQSNLIEAFTAYNCMDNGPLSEADRASYDAQVEVVAPTFAPYVVGYPDGCEVWPYPPDPAVGAISAEGAAPIVVVGTTGDPATPYEASVALADQLSSGVLVTREGEGHTGYRQGNDCVDSAVDAFFVDGTVPEDGLICR